MRRRLSGGAGRLYADAFPEAYQEDFPPRAGSVDLGRLEAIDGLGEHMRVRGGIPRRILYLLITARGRSLTVEEIMERVPAYARSWAVAEEAPFSVAAAARPEASRTPGAVPWRSRPGERRRSGAGAPAEKTL